MLDRLQTLLTSLLPRPIDPQVLQHLSQLVDIFDPRLKSFNSFPRAYLHSYTTACGYAASLLQKMPASVPLIPRDYAKTPLLHALFSSGDAILQAIGESCEIHHCWESMGLSQRGDLYALMGVRRHEKQVFGNVVHNGVVQHDVAQVQVYFDSYTLILPARTEIEYQERLSGLFVESLFRSFAEILDASRERKQALQTEQERLASRLRANTSGGIEIENKLAQVRDELREFSAQSELSAVPENLRRFLAQPERHLRLEEIEVPIDMRGVKRESSNRLAGNFRFYDLVGRDRRRWTLIPVLLRQQDIEEALQRASEKDRWILI